MACSECPMMYSGLVLLADCWCKYFTAGMHLPSLGALVPSARQTRRELTSNGRSSTRHRRTQQEVKTPRPRA